MRNLFASVVYAAALLSNCGLARSQTVQADLWKIPDGSLPDLSSTFSTGQTLPLSWDAWTAPDYIDGYLDICDLWVTSWDPNILTSNYLLKSNINITVPGTFNWNIEIPDDQLALGAKFVLRFKKHTDPASYDPSTLDLSSNGFIVTRSASQSSSSVAAASSTSSSSTTAPTQSPTSTPTFAPTPKPANKSSLSTVAKAGIAIAAAVVGLAAMAGALWMFLQRRRNKTSPPGYSTVLTGEAKPYVDNERASELAGADGAYKPYNVYPTELPPSEPVELDAGRR